MYVHCALEELSLRNATCAAETHVNGEPVLVVRVVYFSVSILVWRTRYLLWEVTSFSLFNSDLRLKKLCAKIEQPCLPSLAQRFVSLEPSVDSSEIWGSYHQYNTVDSGYLLEL